MDFEKVPWWKQEPDLFSKVRCWGDVITGLFFRHISCKYVKRLAKIVVKLKENIVEFREENG